MGKINKKLHGSAETNAGVCEQIIEELTSFSKFFQGD